MKETILRRTLCILSAAVLLLCLAGCGAEKIEEQAAEPETIEITEAAEELAEITEEPTAEPEAADTEAEAAEENAAEEQTEGEADADEEAEPETEDAEAEENAMNQASLEGKTVICVGDSNTWGYEPRSTGAVRYASPWPQLLAENNGCETVNLGENGEKIPYNDYLRNLWLDSVTSRLPADAVIIMWGTNDIWRNPDADAAELAGRMGLFLTALEAYIPAEHILLLAPPSLSTLGEKYGTASANLAEALRALAEEHGISFADTAEWNLETAYDGVHLTEQGHADFAERVAELVPVG